VGAEPILIGRDSSCEIPLADPKVSRVHAEIAIDKGRVVFRDKGSTNGSRVNGFEVYSQALLPGDTITVGISEFTVLDDESEKYIDWDATRPRIDATVSMSDAQSQFDDSPQDILDWFKKNEEESAAAPSREETREMKKRLGHLQTLYNMNYQLALSSSIDDICSLLEKSIFGAMQDVEHICLLLRSQENFEPEMICNRNGNGQHPFSISSAILDRAEKERVGILAIDAAVDDRFSQSDSVVQDNVRSAICTPLIVKDEVIGALYLDNCQKPSCFGADDLALISAFANQAAISLHNASLYENVQKAYHQAIRSLVTMLDAHTPYTVGHTERVARYSVGIAQELELDQEHLELVRLAAELHDIGKIGIDRELVSKPGKLTESEVKMFQSHVVTGEKILKPIEYLRDVLPIVRSHHERFDGSGYTDGLKGDEIPVGARILAVADAFDAMTTQRSYNNPMTFENAVVECRRSAGTQLDPDAVEALAKFLYANYEEAMYSGAESVTIQDG